MLERLTEWLVYFVQNWFWLLPIIADGWFLYRLCALFARPRSKRR